MKPWNKRQMMSLRQAQLNYSKRRYLGRIGRAIQRDLANMPPSLLETRKKKLEKIKKNIKND